MRFTFSEFTITRDEVAKALAQMGLFDEPVIRIGPRGGHVVKEEGGKVEYAHQHGPATVHHADAITREFHAVRAAGVSGRALEAVHASMAALKAGNAVEAIRHSATAAHLSEACEKFNGAMHAACNRGLFDEGEHRDRPSETLYHEHDAPTALALHSETGGHQTRFVMKSADGMIRVPSGAHPVQVLPATKTRKKFPFTGHIDFQGIPVDVENRKGSVRSGKDKDGHDWSIEMRSHYGEIRSTEAPGAVGTDDDNLDVYVGDNADSPLVVVVHQHVPTADGTPGAYDEDKVMLGFNTAADAVEAYKVQYDRPGFYQPGDYEVMPIGAFWRWVHDEKKRGQKVRFVVKGA